MSLEWITICVNSEREEQTELPTAVLTVAGYSGATTGINVIGAQSHPDTGQNAHH